MGIKNNVSEKEEKSIKTYDDFWNWFLTKEKDFFEILKKNENVEKDFFNQISPKLKQLREGYWYVAGMYNDTTAELVLTAEGVIKNIVFVEDLIAAAPEISGWKFTALKAESDITNINISMGDLNFNKDNLFFYANNHSQYPDLIDITLIHSDYNEVLKDQMINGTLIFIDNFLGELNSVTMIDSMNLIGKADASEELIPIEKLKDFIIWREKEFIEKYEGKRYNTENDAYQSLSATLHNGKPLIAIVNSTLLEWDCKASHPWFLKIDIAYEGDQNGMPDNKTFQLMNDFEDDLMQDLKDTEGYLFIGRITAENLKEIYFACKDFKFASTTAAKFQSKYKHQLSMDYDLYKDKYWQSMDQFRSTDN